MFPDTPVSLKGILSPCLFNFYAEYIMRNTRLLGKTAQTLRIFSRGVER